MLSAVGYLAAYLMRISAKTVAPIKKATPLLSLTNFLAPFTANASSTKLMIKNDAMLESVFILEV